MPVEEFIQKGRAGVLIDVRTPAEFELGHIDGAFNLPLFSNEERAEVGTIYKQVGKNEAIERGLEFVGPRMADMVRRAKELSGGRKLFVYCWRGGMRSGSVAWLLTTAGLKACRLEGGYKAYRASFDSIVAKFEGKIKIVGGPTGGGKSEVLHHMQRLGEQVLDLEGLANHKGSVFGGLGLGKQPTTETFINRIHNMLRTFDPTRTLWCEGESKAIGSVFIPESFNNLMLQSHYIYMDVPKEYRVARLVRDYGNFSTEELSIAFDKISKRLGPQNAKQAKEAVCAGDMATAVDIALSYYDKSYRESIFSGRDNNNITEIIFSNDDPFENAKKIIAL